MIDKISYGRKTNISNRTKRRRIAEELQYTNEDVLIIKDGTSSTSLPKTKLQSKIIVVDELTNSSHKNDNKNVNLSSDFIPTLEPNTILTCEDDENKSINSSSDIDNNDNSSTWNYYNDEISYLISSISQWSITFNIPQNALNKLLLILKQHSCFETIPKDARTILHSNIEKCSLRIIEPGNYHHFGILNGIKQHMNIISKK